MRAASHQVGSIGAQALGAALAGNPATTLASLNIGQNRIGAVGTASLAEALASNCTLTSLDVGNNSIGVAGAQALAGAIATNRKLARLDLWSNGIGTAGAGRRTGPSMCGGSRLKADMPPGLKGGARTQRGGMEARPPGPEVCISDRSPDSE